MMSFSTLAFYFFAAIALSAASALILSKNPVHSVLSLVLTFVATAALWIIAQAEFLGIVLILVYVGAVMVLFLFVVMMLDVELEELQSSFMKHIPLAVLISGLLAALLIQWILEANSVVLELPFVSADAKNLSDLGQALFTRFLVPFEVAGVILLTAMVAAIALTFRGKQDLNKAIDPALQFQAKKENRLKIIKTMSED
jgi:NADH-quinone oxidoreductase subunit J